MSSSFLALLASSSLALSLVGASPIVVPGAPVEPSLFEGVMPASAPVSTLEERSGLATVYTTCQEPGVFAMTFDDGPYMYEAELSSTLKNAGATGTYFLNGYNWACIYDQADGVRAAFEAGHLIGSHTWNHADITTLSAAEFEEQLDLVETAFRKILGIKPKWFRPPYGAYNDQALQILKQRGYNVVTWDFDSQDSEGVSAAKSLSMYSELFSSPGTKFPHPHIALNHSPYASTVKTVTPKVLSEAKAAGYRLVSVAECILGSAANSPSSGLLYEVVGQPQKKDSTWTCNGTPAPGAN